jgi:chromosome segregation ATPase
MNNPTTTTHNDMQRLAIGYLKRSGRISWIDWLPLAEVAAESPENWAEAFNQLKDEQQYELLDILRDTTSGPLAETLMFILAAFPLLISDEQVRQFALEFSEQAHQHRVERIERMRDRLLPLNDQLRISRERINEGFDLAIEIQRLEQELTGIRCRETGQDEKFAQVHALEHEIVRMETRKRILEKYDEEARRRYLEELQGSLTAKTAAKEEIERSIATKIVDNDNASKEQANVQAEHNRLQNELEENRKIVAELSVSLGTLTAEASAQRSDAARLRGEHARFLADIERQEKNNRETRNRIDTARVTLQELREDSQRSGMADLEARISQVYALLPPDRADEACR